MRPDITQQLRTIAVLLGLCLLVAACGSRVGDDVREFVIGAGGEGGVQPGAAFDRGEPVDLDDDGFAVGDPDEVATDDPAATGPAATGADGTGTAAGNGQQQAQRDGRPQDTRAMPPGGNGGATDVGVTEDRIVVSNISDISGAVPGLFEDAQLAAQAYFAMFAATEGTVYGRQFEFRPRDARMDTGANRNRYLEACDDSFAVVGSMSAFEQGAAPVIRDCGIPDIRTAVVHPDLMVVPTMFSANVQAPDLLPVAEFHYWRDNYPDVIDKAAYLYIEADTTRFQTGRTMRGTEKLGYEWIYTEQIDIAETNYAPFVLEMRNRGVRFVAFQGAYQQGVRLAEAMRQQNWWPDVYALQANAYTPDFVRSGGAAVESTYIALPSVMLEEIEHYPEMQRYAQWVNQVRPGERPTGLGMFGWSAAKMFVQAVKDVGPELTREKLLAEIEKIETFDGGGLLAPMHVGPRIPSGCMALIQVRDGRFERVAPRERGGFRCADLVEAS